VGFDLLKRLLANPFHVEQVFNLGERAGVNNALGRDGTDFRETLQFLLSGLVDVENAAFQIHFLRGDSLFFGLGFIALGTACQMKYTDDCD